ncbi:MAG: FAD-dependent oxidoreductase [Verrucomicrobiota bacterium]|nr:FAD-dependent oxidoreductase [Verrucomicrobiota bacterium]
MKRLIFFGLLLLSAGSAHAQRVYDVVIYGGTSAGVAAAVQVRRMGHSVVVIEPSAHLGGLTSGGLGWTDSGNKSVIGGISREYYRKIKAHYDDPAAWEYGDPDSYPQYRPDQDAMWAFEPKVAEQLFEEMIAEYTIPVFRNERLNRTDGIEMQEGRITRITMESGRQFSGRMFMDATYEGDLMALAGVTFAVGREPNAQYGEALNGVQKLMNFNQHLFVRPVEAYVVPGDPASGIVARLHGDDPGEDGQGDHRIQAYCFRMCMSRVPENRVPFPKPEGYDEAQYELLFRNFEAGDMRLPLKIDMMPNGKTDTNNYGAFSTDNIGMNYDYPEADYARREEIIREHEIYQKGLMWTLANHPRVPQEIRDKMAVWGLAADEFTDNGNWPHQLYIREARRMVSDYVVTELDCRRIRIVEDSVGLGSYNMDSHNVQRYVTPAGLAQNEGDIQESPGGAYLISYRSIVPRKGETENLLVPVCVSASHIAYGSIRMEPVFMILGQSAATAAILALDSEIGVQDVDYALLRNRLLEDGQVLDLPDAPPSDKTILTATLAGHVVDNVDAEVAGVWLPSTATAYYADAFYLHDNNDGKGQKSVRFEAELAVGEYEVRVAYSAHTNRATNVPVTIVHAEGETTVLVNQRQAPVHDKLFASVGTFRFDGGQAAVVVIGTAGTDGYVIADAVQFLPLAAPEVETTMLSLSQASAGSGSKQEG